MLRSITGNELVVDVAGQALKLAVEKLKYISFVGDMENVPPLKQPVAERPVDQALHAFKELRAATEVGLLREQYSQKLLDTLPRVNEFVNGVGTDWADVRLAMGKATRLYQDALTQWGQADPFAASTQSNWADAAKWVDYAALLASDPGEETHLEKSTETTIMLGASVNGRLGVGDAIMSKELDSSSAGSFNDVFKLVLSSQTNLKIDLMGNGACSPHLTLVDAGGKKLGGSRSWASPATIGRKLNPGSYFLWAGTYAPNEVCSYTLTVGTKP
jgi:hypothetical protein